MNPSNQKRKVCTKFEPQAWRKVLCKNCFKTKEEHDPTSNPPGENQAQNEKSSPESPDSDPYQRNIIRKCLGSSPARPTPKLRHSISLECVSNEETPGSGSRRSLSPGLEDSCLPRGIRPATPFVGNKSAETLRAAQKTSGAKNSKGCSTPVDAKNGPELFENSPSETERVEERDGRVEVGKEEKGESSNKTINIHGDETAVKGGRNIFKDDDDRDDCRGADSDGGDGDRNRCKGGDGKTIDDCDVQKTPLERQTSSSSSSSSSCSSAALQQSAPPTSLLALSSSSPSPSSSSSSTLSSNSTSSSSSSLYSPSPSSSSSFTSSSFSSSSSSSIGVTSSSDDAESCRAKQREASAISGENSPAVAGSHVNNSTGRCALNPFETVDNYADDNYNNNNNNNNNNKSNNYGIIINNNKDDESESERTSLAESSGDFGYHHRLKTDRRSSESELSFGVRDATELALGVQGHGEEAEVPPSPVLFYYDETRIERETYGRHDEPTSDDSEESARLSAAPHGYSSTLKVAIANKTIQLNPRFVSDRDETGDAVGTTPADSSATIALTTNSSDQPRRYVSYLASDSVPSAGKKAPRVRSDCDDGGDMSSYDFLRSEAVMEGHRLLLESLRERNASLEEQFQKLEREKAATLELLTSKKLDYERMKEHYKATIAELESQVQRLLSEKGRLEDRLQLPESERSSLAAEEREIAELRRKLEECENRIDDLVAENEDLRQEVRDVQLEKEELHDQFREEETLEFRELQKELESAAKNYRILQFKLRKAERHNEQLENDRAVYEEKLRHFESCIHTSDDKRRSRMLEEEMRAVKESNQRLHEELSRTEERRRRAIEDLDKTKNALNEADNKRLCLQNEVDNMKHEISRLRDKLKYDRSQDFVPPAKTSSRGSISVDNPIINQLTKDLKDSLERENDLKEQLRFAEKECTIVRKKLTETESECESLNLQLMKFSSAKTSRYARPDFRAIDNGGADGNPTERENDLAGQLEIAEEEIRDLRRQMDNVQKENESLLVAIKYLRGKLEQRDGLRCSTPVGEPKSTRDFLSRIADIPDSKADDKECEQLREQLETGKKELSLLQEKCDQLVKELAAAKKTPDTADVSVNTTIDEEEKGKEKEIRKKLEENLAEYKEKIEGLLKEQEILKEELSSKKKEIENNNKLEVEDCEELTKELQAAKEANKELEGKIKELSEQIEKAQRQEETVEPSPSKVDAETNTEGDEDESGHSDLKAKVDELEAKLKQKETEWAKERGDIEQEANVGCDIATKINRELSSLNESLMDEKLKLLKEKEKLIKDQEQIVNERDELSEEVTRIRKETAQSEKATLSKPENDFKTKEEALQKQLQAERGSFEARLEELDVKIKELEKKNDSLERKYKKAVAKRDKEEADRKEIQEELQALKEKYDKKMYKETEKRRRSEIFIDENKGNEVELLVKLRKDLEDKEKSNERLSKKLKRAEETQLKLEAEIKDLKNGSTQSIPNQRSPGDGEDHVTDVNGNKLLLLLPDGDARGVAWYREQVKSLQAENVRLADASRKTVDDIMRLFEEEQKARRSDEEREVARLKKKIEDNQKQLQKSEKELDDLKDKLRRETSAKVKLESKLKAAESGAVTDSVSETKKPSSLAEEKKTKLDFRSKFEKFEGVARTPRKLSIPANFETPSASTSLLSSAPATSSPSSSSSSSSSSDFLKDVQKQLAELESARSADREELLKKIETQKASFEKEINALEEKNKQLEDRLKDWSKCQKGILEAQMEFEKERSTWSRERGKLQERLDHALGSSSSSKDSPNLIIPKDEDQKSNDVKKSSDVSSKDRNSSETKSSGSTSRFSRSSLYR